jgi:N-acyl homoserine lactone hydrolase
MIELTPTEKEAMVRVYVLDTGLIESSDYSIWSPNADAGEFREMSVRSYLIDHPRGTLLWDTGIDDAIAGLPRGRQIADGIVFRVDTTLGDQLGAIGIAPGDIDYVALSHMHVDHVGNVGLFPDAPVMLQRAEHDAAYGPDPERFTLIPEAYASLDHDRIDRVDGERDVFGDGAVVLTPLPGHTPGHQGLLVRLRDSGAILLAGDIAYSARDYAEEAVRRGNVDLDASRRSIQTAKRIERELGAAVWLHHDLEAQRSVQTAPRYYA